VCAHGAVWHPAPPSGAPADAKIKLDEFCQRVRQNLDNATLQDKKLALNVLDIWITASNQNIDIKGIILIEVKPLPSSVDVTTIAQTSGYHLVWIKNYPITDFWNKSL
jgi:hypothetical protein